MFLFSEKKKNAYTVIIFGSVWKKFIFLCFRITKQNQTFFIMLYYNVLTYITLYIILLYLNNLKTFYINLIFFIDSMQDFENFEV